METRCMAPAENKSPELSCALCGSSAIETAFRSHGFHYGSRERTAEFSVEVPSRECWDCGFTFLDAEAEELKHDAVCRHLGVLTPREVRRNRKRYGMNASRLRGSLRAWRCDPGPLGERPPHSDDRQ